MDAFKAGTLPTSYVPAAFFVTLRQGSQRRRCSHQRSSTIFVENQCRYLKVQFEQHVEHIHGLDNQKNWDNISPLPKDFYRPTVEIIRKIQECAGRDIYVMPTVYSAYQVARQSLRDENIAKAAVERPDDLKRVLGYYLNSLEWICQGMQKNRYRKLLYDHTRW